MAECSKCRKHFLGCKCKWGTMVQLCCACQQEKPETTASFHRRNKDLNNVVPFTCRDCFLLSDKKERPKHYTQIELKKVVHRFKKNSAVANLREEEKIRKRSFYRVQSAIIRAKRAKAFVPLEKEEKQKIKKFYENCPEGSHVDHIIPISKGGLHILSNLQYLTAQENFKKSDHLDWNLSNLSVPPEYGVGLPENFKSKKTSKAMPKAI